MPDVPEFDKAGKTEIEEREREKIKRQVLVEIRENDERLENYQSILDQAYEFLGSIMSNEQIRNMPYKILLYEMERRRLYLEATRSSSQNTEIEKQLKTLNSKNKH